MAILRDYKCSEHGYFESFEPICPTGGCTDGISVVMLQAPSTISAKTKATDGHVEQLALSFGMSDIKSTREGESQAGYLLKKNKFSQEEYRQAEQHLMQKTVNNPRPRDAAIWGDGGRFSMQNIISGNAIRSTQGESVGILPKDVGIMKGPKVDQKAVFKDHENLKIK